MCYHRPALLHESIEGLNIRPGGIYVDLTFGGGGHSLEVLKKLETKGRLVAFDQDEDALANVPEDKRVTFVGANFRYLRNYLRYHAIEKVDGILADLGISSHQIDIPERGFSFKSDAGLDMRMDVRGKITAARVLNSYTVRELTVVFRNWGELSNGRALAAAVDLARKERPLSSTVDLEEALKKYIPRGKPSKFLAKVYQALRIEVNAEMDALKEMLLQTTDVLGPDGRLVVITYHSIEDRLVKNFMRSGNLEGEIAKDFYGRPQTPWKLVNRSVITPGPEELEENNRARSAKLRIAERVE
ncbi:MAG: 16S rRNA (cytosine(1402)-N(4))-methyltransferase RsmH [Bacteroidetes bacterium]|nr:16S rRNA (cytosine(1402)-N(4))-methyltransferase RsmH [Bacteroidota bacterium]